MVVNTALLGTMETLLGVREGSACKWGEENKEFRNSGTCRILMHIGKKLRTLQQ